jgi:hypothetical protein
MAILFIARSLGEGHRIIRGVAGSGKTLILAFRAEYLARAATKPVLILCFANGIAGRLEDAMQNRGVASGRRRTGKQVFLDDGMDTPIAIDHLSDAEVHPDGHERNRLVLGKSLRGHQEVTHFAKRIP